MSMKLRVLVAFWVMLTPNLEKEKESVPAVLNLSISTVL